MKNNMILDVRNIEKSYNKGYSVLKGISFQVYQGDFISIMGSSGCGKTTLLKSIGTLSKVNKGNVIYRGESIVDIYGEKLARIRRTEISFIFQDYYLMNSLTTKDNIMLPLILDGSDSQASTCKAEEIAKILGIEHLLNKYPYELSGGEKQRTAICRAIIGNAELILADEPTGNLDSNASGQVIRTLAYINKELKKTIIMVTHDPKMASYSQKTLFLKDGVIANTVVKNESNEDYYVKILNGMMQL